MFPPLPAQSLIASVPRSRRFRFTGFSVLAGWPPTPLANVHFRGLESGINLDGISRIDMKPQ